MKKFDVVIIGFGKGGRTLAGDFASQGKKVAMIEKSRRMYGGSCPNVGCVPTKFLVNQSEISEIKDFKTFEEKAAFYTFSVVAKKQLRQKLLGKMQGMFEGNPNVTLYTGKGRFVSAAEVEVTGEDFKEVIYGDKIIIDTGSIPIIPPVDGLKESKHTYTSEGMLDLETLPRRLVIIGGGNIGLEFASFYRRFGSDVTVLQDLAEFLPNEDDDVAKCVKDAMDAAGIKFEFGVKVGSVKDTEYGSVVTYKVGDEKRTVTGDAVLVSTGRRPNTDELNLSAAGITVTHAGAVVTNERLRTSNPNIWAIGDVVGGPQFTYISHDDSRVVKSDMTGGDLTVTNRSVPYCVFLSPSLSRAGLTEKAAIAAGYKVRTATIFPASLPRCHVLGKYTGMLKAVVDADSGMILGVSLFCEESHEMVNFVKMAMDFKMPYTVLRDHMFTHPIMSEALNDLFAAIK